MAYAASYALYNYRLADPSLGHTPYSNLRLIRAFERGLDPASSEAGFILTHVDMVQHSAGLVRGAVDLLRAASTPSHPGAIAALDLILETMTAVDASMETMWSHSKPKEYLNYRTFIFGITNQSMFPSGVVYAGQSDDQPQHFRGESGANDSMIPLLDALLQIPMPANPLTEILKDFRHYRPRPHREFLAAVREQAAILNIRAFCCPEAATDEQNIALTTRYLRLLDHVRAFRWRHWLFAREYIIKYSAHPTATGGSPIIRWLPNQLAAVMELMGEVWAGIPDAAKKDPAVVPRGVVEMMEVVEEQRERLAREVEKFCLERGQ